MKISITGHTSGIGNAIYKYFINNGDDVLGFSRSTGYNIFLDSDRKRIIDESINSDIFVNNAYNNFDNCQTILLKEIFKKWEHDEKKLIINISSRWTNCDNIYCSTKKDQDMFCESKLYMYPKIINIKPGMIDTPRVKQYNNPKMDSSYIIEILHFILSSKNKFLISSLTFGI